MIALLTEKDLPLLADLQQSMLLETGLKGNRAASWRKHTEDIHLRSYRDGTCVHAGWWAGPRLVAMAGAVVIQDAFFLGLRAGRRGLIVDEYVLPEYRRQGIEGRLRDHLLVWLAAQQAPLVPVLPSNSARMACSAALGFRL